MSGSPERLPRRSGSDRARLVREIAGVLSAASGTKDAIEQCLPLLKELANAERAIVIGPGTIVEALTSDRMRELPIRFGETLLGKICIVSDEPWDAELQALLESCALHIGARLYHEQVVASSQRYAHLALTDALTGIANRRNFDERLVAEWQRGRREASPISLLMMDLDYFKNFNDTYGHQAGDACLHDIAVALQTPIGRSSDLLARYGGEEFVALLPGTDLAGAVALAEMLRAAVHDAQIAHGGSSLGRVSVSIGAATRVPSADGSPHELLHAADDALYRAKLGGRNRVYADGYESDAAPARRAISEDRTNVPTPLTPLVGRRKELAELVTLVERNRLLSVVGVGGAGKTRISMAAASELHYIFDDGVWFVDLAALREARLVSSRIATAFRSDVGTAADAPELLARHIGCKRALLVLDNAEHLLRGVGEIVETLLSKCPNLHVVVTTREPLAKNGEAVYRLPLLEPKDACELFSQRMNAGKREVEIRAGDARVIEQLCLRLDGLALAIELAASRAALVGVEQVAHDMERHLGSENVMKGAIDWSYDALAPEERALFRRLAVFAGGFGFDDALEVCEERAETLEALIRKSLVVNDLANAGRYRLLELVRQYAHERLRETREEEQLYSARHAEHFCRVAAIADRSFPTAGAGAWFSQFTPEIENFRAAFAWTLEERNDVNLGAALVAQTKHLFDNLYPSESVRWTKLALSLGNAKLPPTVEARLLLNQVNGSRSLPAPELRAAAERAVALYRRLDDPLHLSDALRAQAQIIGWYFRQERELADTIACEAIEVARTVGDPLHLAYCLRTRGLTIDLSDIPAKRAVLEEALGLIRRYGNERQIASMLTWISEFEFSAGDNRRAYQYGLEGVRVAETSGARSVHANTAGNLSSYAVALGEWDVARTSASVALAISRQTSDPEHFTFAVQTFADIAAHDGKPQLAARLLGFTDSRCGVLHPHRQADQSEDLSYRRLIARLERELPDLREQLAAGARLTEPEVLGALSAECGFDP